nr:hypothetical protein [Tanacetum cinerariifolium]
MTKYVSTAGVKCHVAIGNSLVQARPERLSNLLNEPPLGEGNPSRSGEDSMQLLELMNICTKLSGKVTTLENELKSTKVVYNKALITLTKRIKKLEKKLNHKRRRAVVDSSEDEEASLDKEDSPKQERMIEEIDEDENTNLVKSSKQGEAHETARRKKESDDTEVVNFSTASPQKDDDEETLAKTLVSIKKSAEKDKGDVGYYEIHRADGSYKTYIFFSEMLNDFDREDMIVLYRLFNEKYASTRLGFDDLMLWGDMKIMFEPDGDDAV